MAEVETYFIDNNNLIKLTGLRDAANALYLNGASVSVTMLDAATDAEITGQTWPLTMDYVASSSGTYQATLDYDLVVSPGQSLVAKVVANAGEGLRLSLRVPVTAKYRDGE